MNTRCIVVIGHVDHGKTSLVGALTGIETDRTAEEKARGLSIVPGFAHKAYPDGTLDFIDAPGHEDFIQAMVSGTSGAQAALLVVSAAEGVGEQTLEHLNIASLLGITQGVIAVTKSDLLSPLEHDACLNTLKAALSDTSLADAPMIMCSAKTSDGLDALHETLQSLLLCPPPTDAPLHSMLPIDRVFLLAGHGTVVTGTLLGQDLNVGEQAVVHPSGLPVTLRGLQSRGQERTKVHAGERVAVNLRGAAVADIPRGSVLCLPDTMQPSECIDAVVQLGPTISPLKHMEKVRVLFGTTNAVATVRLFGGRQLHGSKSGLVQLRFGKEVLGFAGQRAILRRLSPAQTLGGAVFLDPQATATRSGDASRSAILSATLTGSTDKTATALCAAQRGAARLTDIARLLRMHPAETAAALVSSFTDLGEGWLATTQDVEDRKTDMLQALSAYHATHPLRMSAPQSVTALKVTSSRLLKYVEGALFSDQHIRRFGNTLALTTHDPIALLSDEHKQRLDDLEADFRNAGVTSASQAIEYQGIDADLIALLVQAGTVVSLNNVSLKQTLLFHTGALNAAANALRLSFPARTPFTTSQARSALGTSRRIIVPVLEHFDTSGITTAGDDLRQVTAALPVSPILPT
ncbi:MAG: selenocysteine-specific translation elongation factor [Sulfitobacter sp.]